MLRAAALAAMSGFAQFGVAAALGDVAADYGEILPDLGLTERPGLTGTTLGIGLAIIRLASLGALPLGSIADRVGRRKVILTSVALGLALTATAATSPTFWWFVAIFAIGRPMLSATNAVALVIAAEETTAKDRSKAVAVISAAYGVGAGITALIRGFAADPLGFRGLFALALIPLVLVPLVGRGLPESRRFRALGTATAERAPVLGWIHPSLRTRLALLAVLTAALGFVSGPANSFLFFFAESIQGLAPSTLAFAVLAAGPIGLAGLIVGRAIADTHGRRLGAGAALVAVALAGVLTYNAGRAGVIAGYLIGIFCAAAYAPAAGSLSAELFPTSHRSTVAGWLTASAVLGAVAGIILFGALADRFEGFGPSAALIAAPVVIVSVLYARLPESRGLELEESAPEPA
ncbi:MAG: MFS transporter [Actinomycetota bacterium]